MLATPLHRTLVLVTEPLSDQIHECRKGITFRRETGRNDGATVGRERVKQTIRRQIARGLLQPGQQMIEAEVAAELEMSRTPVREAFRELEQQGLVVSYPFRGTFIRSLTAKDVEDITYARAAIEGMAARQVCENASRGQLRQLEALVRQMGSVQGPDVGDQLRLIDLEFHECLVTLSANERLVELWRTFDPLLWLLLGNAQQLQNSETVERIGFLEMRHRRIVEAIVAGEPNAAEQTVREHVLSSGLDIAESMNRRQART